MLTTTRPDGTEHPVHLGDRGDPVLHEHQAHLTEHNIEGGIPTGGDAASATRKSILAPSGAGTVFATSIMSPEMSIPVTDPVVPTRSAASLEISTRATRDVEHPFTRL